MNKNEKQISAAAELLISLKSFSDLTEVERSILLEEMSEDEYKLLYETALESTRALHHNDSFDDNSLKNTLLAAYDKKYSTPKNRSVLMYNIPLYQAVAAIILVVFTLLGFNYYSQKQDSATQHIVYVEKKDTVYIPSRSVAIAPVNSKVNNDDSLTNSKKGISSPVHKTQLNYIGNSYSKEKQVAGISQGRSIKQDSSLKQFMVASLR
jgi:hypothetical protein